MTGSIGIVLLVLIIAGFVCLRAGGGVIFVNTPGDGLPGAAASMFSAVNGGGS